jgi:hypothetical protein
MNEYTALAPSSSSHAAGVHKRHEDHGRGETVVAATLREQPL